MNAITLLQPPRIVFGNGCAAGCVDLLAQRGVRRVLLVSSSPVLPHLAFLLDSLRRAHCDVVQSRPVDQEPTVAVFEEVLKTARAEKVEAVLGVGGGSALDVAKLAAALANGRQNVAEVFGIGLLQRRELFLVCLPTTSGTGSEVSPNSILLDEADQLKKGVVSPHLVSDAAYIDPLLTLSVPPSVTAATGMDALTHCIEAYANKFAHPIVDAYAVQGMRLISDNLLAAVRNGSDPAARANLALGSLYGGLCLGPVNTAAVHALAYPLGSRFHVAHGISNAVLLPHVLRFNLAAAPDRYAGVALALGLPRSSSTSETATRGVDHLVQLSQACGIPARLSDLGVPRDAIPSMAKSAMQVTRLLKNNLRTVSEEDAVRIYEASY
ncbi:MAG TPA: iron-containing alcohol dehydrogenase [Verrucomicrobiae bacterium]|nr:iron-containing alcohol dehydrogenase [Verrucomicrobiae bacterium]